MISQAAVISLTDSLSTSEFKAYLANFIQQSMSQSYDEKPDKALKLLDSAWAAQKLLWALRDQTMVEN
ncbi:MAG TPA: hypothetical protein DEG17_24695 [Cyanobacteria bacterium UBA11149]|nr:hypothetical protein [Cyanobacteria bacterium UBA11367]HBE56743.1 hypothetical protein [Cyanobacteria bacterium UBA11366]HBK65719.1 hypothetical protein [Cyanobacteria bacterium UBA11166]HBR76234.1 hypothetical protein [Cyanobacteria bacterium UBA11159]HBS71295.1 hypothetical protein [Cyanobacteria bacterium UBA11153]HBW91978.1 hypothetical protein [Cyanobacteria bacterium UBA11149]HCA96949.1 hypothetical protein [Cyanobacteria bacterium UBA9226]